MGSEDISLKSCPFSFCIDLALVSMVTSLFTLITMNAMTWVPIMLAEIYFFSWNSE